MQLKHKRLSFTANRSAASAGLYPGVENWHTTRQAVSI